MEKQVRRKFLNVLKARAAQQAIINYREITYNLRILTPPKPYVPILEEPKVEMPKLALDVLTKSSEPEPVEEGVYIPFEEFFDHKANTYPAEGDFFYTHMTIEVVNVCTQVGSENYYIAKCTLKNGESREFVVEPAPSLKTPLLAGDTCLTRIYTARDGKMRYKRARIISILKRKNRSIDGN